MADTFDHRAQTVDGMLLIGMQPTLAICPGGLAGNVENFMIQVHGELQCIATLTDEDGFFHHGGVVCRVLFTSLPVTARQVPGEQGIVRYELLHLIGDSQIVLFLQAVLKILDKHVSPLRDEPDTD